MLIPISFRFLLDPSPSIALSFQSVLLLNFTQYVGYVKVVRWISNKLLYGFCKIDTWISLSCHMYLSKDCYMDFSEVLNGFVKVGFSKLFYAFIDLCQTKPSWSLTKISKLVEASSLNYREWMGQSSQCLGSAVPLAMFFYWRCRGNMTG